MEVGSISVAEDADIIVYDDKRRGVGAGSNTERIRGVVVEDCCVNKERTVSLAARFWKETLSQFELDVSLPGK